MILVVSHPDDAHARRVIVHLRGAGHEVHLLDLSDLPDRASLSLDFADPLRPGLELRPDDGPPLDLGRVSATWWRRPQAPNPTDVADLHVRLFASSEWNEAVQGLWLLLGGRWMNEPGRDERASRKASQLRIASEVGLRVPRTLMTSDPDRAREFIASVGVGRTIFKTFAATPTVWRETRIVRETELATLDAVRVAPVIFQEYVEADADLRVTVVGERVFAMAIHAGQTDYPVDFRMSLGQARTEVAELPAAVTAAIHRLMDRLGLAYGAIDLRRTPEGEHVFLEINTAGEFLFVEERTGLPIAAAVADWLSASDVAASDRIGARTA
jgi:glutathione synthase/RimK-type ligase-like ATP-grasp enzyme